ncbi:MAG: hypothetical protein R6V57_10045 [Vicinamibacterales bacterium]
MRPDSLRRFALTCSAGAAIALLAGTGMPGCAAGKSAQALTQSPSQCGRLSARGTDIVCSDGTRFEWRGVTAFALVEQIAHGRRRDADAYMRWAHATGFNLVRVLAMADVLFTLAPDEGLRHMPALFEMAALRGLYVEIVALADTASYGMDLAALRAQVSAVSRLAADHPNVVVQIANEHYHPTQMPEVHDPAVLADLGGLIAPQVLHTESPAAEETAARPAGRYLTRHLSRSGSPARMLDRVDLLRRLAVEAGKPVVNDEPIGAGERDEPGRRLSDPGFFRDLASRTRIAGLAGGTFHCEDGLFARVPGPVQQACARAWVQGASVTVPSAPRFP